MFTFARQNWSLYARDVPRGQRIRWYGELQQNAQHTTRRIVSRRSKGRIVSPQKVSVNQARSYAMRTTAHTRENHSPSSLRHEVHGYQLSNHRRMRHR